MCMIINGPLVIYVSGHCKMSNNLVRQNDRNCIVKFLFKSPLGRESKGERVSEPQQGGEGISFHIYLLNNFLDTGMNKTAKLSVLFGVTLQCEGKK